MSLHNDINNLTKTLENSNKNTLNQLKESEKQKNNLYIAKIEILDDLKEEIKLCLKYNGDPFSTEIKTNIIENMLNYTKKIYSIKYTNAFILANYDKIAKELLKEEEKRQKEAEKLRQIQLKEAEKQRILKQAQKQQAFNNILKAIKTIIFILSAPFILLIYFVIGICKNVK